MSDKNKNDYATSGDRTTDIVILVGLFFVIVGCVFSVLIATGVQLVWSENNAHIEARWQAYDKLNAECIEREIELKTCENVALQQSGLINQFQLEASQDD